MQIDDPRLNMLEVDGQRLYVPSPEAWAELWEHPTLEDRSLPVPNLLRTKVQKVASYAEIIAALGFAHDRVYFYELLFFNGAPYRVFIEAVVCDHCRYRALISATPGVSEIYWGSENEVAAQERSWSLPLQSCFSCKKPLYRRSTVWQVNAVV